MPAIHIPGYHYCGPGTWDFSKEPVNTLDSLCRSHDVEGGANYNYFRWGNADEAFYQKLKQYVGRTKDWVGRAILSLFGLKRLGRRKKFMQWPGMTEKYRLFLVQLYSKLQHEEIINYSPKMAKMHNVLDHELGGFVSLSAPNQCIWTTAVGFEGGRAMAVLDLLEIYDPSTTAFVVIADLDEEEDFNCTFKQSSKFTIKNTQESAEVVTAPTPDQLVARGEIYVDVFFVENRDRDAASSGATVLTDLGLSFLTAGLTNDTTVLVHDMALARDFREIYKVTKYGSRILVPGEIVTFYRSSPKRFYSRADRAGAASVAEFQSQWDGFWLTKHNGALGMNLVNDADAAKPFYAGGRLVVVTDNWINVSYKFTPKRRKAIATITTDFDGTPPITAATAIVAAPLAVEHMDQGEEEKARYVQRG